MLRSAQTKARLFERQPDLASSSSTLTWPGGSPAKATRPDPLDAVNHWKARLWPARARLPISVAVRRAAFKKPPPLLPSLLTCARRGPTWSAEARLEGDVGCLSTELCGVRVQALSLVELAG